MVLYLVKWVIDSDLSKGKGRAKSSDSVLCYTVICRNSKDALSCLDFHFRQHFPVLPKFTIDDGQITLKRMTVDSRNFTANYLMMDGIKQPIILSDLKSNGLRSHLIW